VVHAHGGGVVDNQDLGTNAGAPGSGFWWTIASAKRRAVNSEVMRLIDSECPRQMKPPGFSASYIASAAMRRDRSSK
jgi:hypothetical protein